MLFKKRSKALDKENHFINLALQDEGKKEVNINEFCLYFGELWMC